MLVRLLTQYHNIWNESVAGAHTDGKWLLATVKTLGHVSLLIKLKIHVQGNHNTLIHNLAYWRVVDYRDCEAPVLQQTQQM